MNKNRKIIAFICAISMVFSVFGAFTFSAGAADIEKGIILEYDKDASTETKAVIVAKYVGAEKLDGYTIKVNVPETVTSVDYKSEFTGWFEQATQPSAENNYVYGMSAAFGSVVASNNPPILGTITVNLSEPLKSQFDLKLQTGSTISFEDGELLVEDESLPVASVKVPTDPNATPAPEAQDRPEGNDDPKPTVKDPVPVNKGITLEYDAKNSTDTKKVIIAKYVGAEKLDGYTIKLNVPETVTSVDYKSEFTGWFEQATQPSAENNYVYGMSAAFGSVVASNNPPILGTITLNLSAPMTSAFETELQTGSTISFEDGELLVEDNSLPNAWVKVPASTVVPANTVALKDIVDITVVGDDDAETNSPYYAVVTATKNGSKATYGTDYKAYYNGTELTEGQLTNYLVGKYGKVSDALANITFEYNDGVTIAVEVDKDGVKEPLSTGTTTPVTPPDEPDFNDPKLSVTPSKKTVTVGTKVTITPTLVENDAIDGKLTVDTGDADAYALKVAVDEKNVVTFIAALKGKVTVTYTYTYKDDEKNEQTKTATSEITIKNEGGNDDDDNNSSSGSSSSNGMGPIAGPNTGVIGGTGVGVASFTDLGDVAWAQEAITTLAAKGIVNGRDANTFDPNANITRAEYCQILVGAIGKSQESADSSFDDVASNAWYYHSVSVASSYGIVSGYGDGNFGPNDLITRQDMALMTYKAAQVMGTNLTAQRTLTFGDADQISDYAAEAVNTLANAGIINGMSETEFAPLNNATRAQAAVILYQTFVK